MIGDHLVEASGKLVVLDKMLSYLKSAGHKVLLFSNLYKLNMSILVTKIGP
jgi:SNF2 family DNA or RNA helicase